MTTRTKKTPPPFQWGVSKSLKGTAVAVLGDVVLVAEQGTRAANAALARLTWAAVPADYKAKAKAAAKAVARG